MMRQQEALRLLTKRKLCFKESFLNLESVAAGGSHVSVPFCSNPILFNWVM